MRGPTRGPDPADPAVLVASAVFTAIGVRVAAQSATSDSSRVAAVDALQAEAELDLDAALRAEWDALLADPVDLDRGDLQRLRALPWIAAADIAAIAAARPFATVDDLARLPGWSRDAVERLRPFVEVHPQPRRAPRWNA
jgi:DNA uptake protein ComE-like DNA-binding protein